MQIFTRDIVTASPALAWVTRWLVTLVPKFKHRVVHQLDDVQAIDDLGIRLDVYRGIDIPIVVLEGDRPPTSILERSEVLRRVLPDARRIVLSGQGHAAHIRAPDRLATIIADFADEVFARIPPGPQRNGQAR